MTEKSASLPVTGAGAQTSWRAVAAMASGHGWRSDCCDPGLLSWAATTTEIDVGLMEDVMMQAVENQFGANQTAPTEIEWPFYNGGCYTAADTCSFACTLGLKSATVFVYSPQSNEMAESFMNTVTRDYAKLALRPATEARKAALGRLV